MNLIKANKKFFFLILPLIVILLLAGIFLHIESRTGEKGIFSKFQRNSFSLFQNAACTYPIKNEFLCNGNKIVKEEHQRLKFLRIPTFLTVQRIHGTCEANQYCEGPRSYSEYNRLSPDTCVQCVNYPSTQRPQQSPPQQRSSCSIEEFKKCNEWGQARGGTCASDCKTINCANEHGCVIETIQYGGNKTCPAYCKDASCLAQQPTNDAEEESSLLDFFLVIPTDKIIAAVKTAVSTIPPIALNPPVGYVALAPAGAVPLLAEATVVPATFTMATFAVAPELVGIPLAVGGAVPASTLFVATPLVVDTAVAVPAFGAPVLAALVEGSRIVGPPRVDLSSFQERYQAGGDPCAQKGGVRNSAAKSCFCSDSAGQIIAVIDMNGEAVCPKMACTLSQFTACDEKCKGEGGFCDSKTCNSCISAANVDSCADKAQNASCGTRDNAGFCDCAGTDNAYCARAPREDGWGCCSNVACGEGRTCSKQGGSTLGHCCRDREIWDGYACVDEKCGLEGHVACHNASGELVCKNAGHPSGNQSICCPGGQEWDGRACKCPEGQTVNEFGACEVALANCPAGAEATATCKCSGIGGSVTCSAGYTCDASAGSPTCLPPCPSGQKRVNGTCREVCGGNVCGSNQLCECKGTGVEACRDRLSVGKDGACCSDYVCKGNLVCEGFTCKCGAGTAWSNSAQDCVDK